MKKAKELRAQARAALKGRYWLAFLAALIASLLGGVMGSSGGTAASGTAASGSTAGAPNGYAQFDVQLTPEQAETIAIIAGVVLTIAAISAIVLLVIGGAVELGYDTFNLKLYETGEKPTLKLLFSRFDIFGKAFGLRLLILLKTFLWSLLFVIPGIIASYRYAMAPYLMAENPALSASEAINRSKALMAGHKWRLFCLQLSFIGWLLLSVLTCGIGLAFLAPYQKAAETAFYLALPGRAAQEQTAPAAL